MSSSPTDLVAAPASTGTLVDVLMPAMGTSVVEGTIVDWRVEVGGTIAADEPICEISTDKVDSECPSPASGVLAEILVTTGETVEVGTVLGRIATGDGAAATAPASPDGNADAETGGGVGIPTFGDAAPDRATPAADTGAVDGHAGGTPSKDNGNGAATAASRRELLRSSSPVAVRIAEEHGLDVTRLSGSGRNGRVTKRDVLLAIEAGVQAAPRAGDDAPMHIESPYRPDPGLLVAGATANGNGVASSPGPPAIPTVPAPSALSASSSLSAPSAPGRAAPPVAPPAAAPVPPAVPDELGGVATPLSRMRTSIGTAMRRSLDTAAHATTIVECDMSRIERRRRELGVTALPLLARHAIDTLREFPALNATFDGETLLRYERVHLGIAVSLGEDGLIVPVIHDAQDLSPEGIARRIKDVAVRARGKQLAPDEVRGGTFTITNPGASGALIATPVINVPQVAILDLEAIVRRPVVVTDADGQESIAIRPMVNLCMSWDHRVLDGVYAAQFLTALRRRIEGVA